MPHSQAIQAAVDCDVVIVGSGFSGIAMGYELKCAGIESFVILERADGPGGTWRDNSYPGAACDVPSHLYSFSFEPNPAWTRFFAPQPEIRDYLRRCLDKFGLAAKVAYGREVTSARFDAPRCAVPSVPPANRRRWPMKPSRSSSRRGNRSISTPMRPGRCCGRRRWRRCMARRST